MGVCSLCGRASKIVSRSVGVCYECLTKHAGALTFSRTTHASYRSSLGLPEAVPEEGGKRCVLCVNECSIGDGRVGYCGLWRNEGGLLRHVAGLNKFLGLWYLDPHPTNCVAGPVCPANTGRGYPKYTLTEGVEVGYSNLAVFFGGCMLNCLFCQNFEHKEMVAKALKGSFKALVSVDEVVEVGLSDKVSCVCFFGGDPGPHAPQALAIARKLLTLSSGKVKRVCWETNGLENPSVMSEMAKVSLTSGGIVKIDWKAWTPQVYEALAGVNGVKAVERVKENVKLVNELSTSRPEPPLLVVSTLLVPGYVTIEEVKHIAEFLANVNPNIPYVLLAFYPTHLMSDLPTTSREHAFKAYEVARNAGLKEVFIGNVWLLSNSYTVKT